MLYYIKKTWKNSFLTILCQVISYSIEVFAALASMKMLDGLLAQDTQLFLFGLVAHLGVWAISFLASHMETVFHYRAQRQINELERKDMVEMLLKKSYSEYYAEESGSYLSGFTNDIAQMEQLGASFWYVWCSGADCFQLDRAFLSSLEFTCRINYLWYSDGSVTPNFQSEAGKCRKYLL